MLQVIYFNSNIFSSTPVEGPVLGLIRVTLCPLEGGITLCLIREVQVSRFSVKISLSVEFSDFSFGLMSFYELSKSTTFPHFYYT